MAGMHSRFAPSKAAVWSRCHGALALIESAALPPEVTNIHAASGTLTHEIAAQYATDGLLPMVGAKRIIEGFDFMMDQERIDRAAFYIDKVKARGGMQFYEVGLRNDKVIGIDNQWGTGDAIVVDIDNAVLEAHDLKDGMGIVAAADNDQLIDYLLMARQEFSYLCEFKTFRGFIWQPRANWESQVEYTAAEMDAHAQRLFDAAQSGQTLLNLRDMRLTEAALTPGEHCVKGWCPARSWCPARASAMNEIMPDVSVPSAALDDARLGAILSTEASIKAYFDSLRGEALSRAKAGTDIPGWKLATGRQGPRAWIKADEVAIGDAMYDVIEADAYERSLISPTVAQKKLLNKHPEAWAALQKYITRSEGQITLVPEADGRAPISLDIPEFENVHETGADLL
jgi:hypothetical protein